MKQEPQFKTGNRRNSVKVDRLVIVISILLIMGTDAVESIYEIDMIISVKNTINGFIFMSFPAVIGK